jgi:hypothetical protein
MIKHLTHNISPLIKLSFNTPKFTRGLDALLRTCVVVFLTLMKLLTTAHVLSQPDIKKSFDVYCDAFGTGIGGILMQDGHAIAYTSRQR